MLFVNLGAAALFDPDEGRNAERARELLLLGRWAVPHENFLPALDKPVFFYWLIAAAYKFFGISEWSARLPSALAALGCLIIVYRFARSLRSEWQGVASVITLATSLQFFLFARIVIFDMVLTFFIALALLEFYRAASAPEQRERRRHSLIMYSALAFATLIKGPIGFALPGMVIFAFLIIRRRWHLLRDIDLPLGAAIFAAIVLPVYLWAEIESPGYLSYFFWQENVLRFFTPHFQRIHPWYYYLLVITVGFMPWSVLIPNWLAAQRKKKLTDRDLFLILWIVVPLLFFSLSRSKLPQYLLPIFPPLAILIANRLMEIVEAPHGASRWPLALPLIIITGAIGYLAFGTFRHAALPPQLRLGIDAIDGVIWVAGITITIVGAIFLINRRRWHQAIFVLGCYGAATLVYLVATLQLSIQVANQRSAKPVANQLGRVIAAEDRIVHYDGYITGLLFYLRREQPSWIVWSGKKTIIMDNMYVAEEQPAPVTGYGQVLFTYEDFAAALKREHQPVKIITKTKNLPRLHELNGTPTKLLAKFGEYALLSSR